MPVAARNLASAFQLRQGLQNGTKVIKDHECQANNQKRNPHRRRVYDNNAQEEQNAAVCQEFGVVYLERDVPSGIHNTDAVAHKIAEEGGDCGTHNAPEMNQDDVEHNVDNCGHQACPE